MNYNIVCPENTQFIDHVSQAKSLLHPFPDRLYVITMVSNPQRFRSRYELYRAFEKHMADSGVILYTAEVAFGDRKFEVTEANNPLNLQLRTATELWHKENVLNLLLARLPADWKYVAWIDSDVMFARPNWAQETIHALQHYSVIQPWSQCLDVGPDYEIVPDKSGGESLRSMMYQYHHTNGWDADPYKYYSPHTGHCGYAWAATRKAIDDLGGFIDWAILGSADNHMARGLMGKVLESCNPKMSQAYKNMLLQWQTRSIEHVKYNIGYVHGLLVHYWHGPKQNRRYMDRWKILVDHKFDPNTDIKKDAQGLWQLSGNKPGLRDDLRRYFRQRNEDSIEAGPPAPSYAKRRCP